MIKKILTACIVIVLVFVGGYVTSSILMKKEDVVENVNARSRSIEEIQAEQGKPVKVASITQEDISLTQTFYGTAAAYEEANVQGKHGGTIVKLKGKEGDSVTAGETIVQFDTIDIELELQQAVATKNSAVQSVKQAESNYETTQRDLNRYQELFKDGFVPKQKVDSQENSLQVNQASLGSAKELVKNAEAKIKLLKNELKDMTIKAPISGIIDEKYFNLNEIAGDSDVIYHIVDIDQVYIEVEIPETYISQIQEHMPVKVAIDSLKEKKFSGSVERIIPTGNSQSRNFVVKVLVNNSEHQIKPGMFARVDIGIESIPNALVFNKKALVKNDDGYAVFKVVDDQVEKAPVEVKHRDGTSVAVYSNNLTPQDKIVVEGAYLLKANDRVKIL
jgi:RND family efflux transporter MFP subunit